MTYSDLLIRLYQKRGGIKQRPFPITTPYSCIHIAGSNGKGTVAWKIAETLRLNGYRTGLYTSPHISSYRERIRINGAPISEDELVPRLKERIERDAHFFEITTSIAHSYFTDRQVDVAVIETGLGGEFDATSAIQPDLTIITSLSLEHTDILGNTLEDIARAKAGILKKGIPVILGSQVEKSLIEPYAEKLGCPIIHCLPSDNPNKTLAEQALKQLPFTASCDNEGLNSRPPCRMELAPHPEKTIMLDVAHNPDALTFLFRQVQNKYPGKPIRCLLALSSTKPIRKCLEIVGRLSKEPIFFECDHPRLHPARSLQNEAEKMGMASSISADIHSLVEKMPSDCVLLACGSFFMMSDIRKQLGINEICDPIIPRKKNLRL